VDHVSTDRWLTPGVRGIGGASLLADLGHEIPTSLLPSFLTSTLGAPAAALGLIEGAADAVAGAARFGGGVLSDDPERRRSVAVGGYTATAVLSALIGLATAVWQVAVLRVGAWLARGLRVPARNALLADVTRVGTYGRAYGFERMMDNLGAVGGPLLALALVAAIGVRGAILVSVVFGLMATGSIVYAIRHIRRPAPSERVQLRIRIKPLLEGRLGRIWLPIGAFEAGNVATTLLILRATELLSPDRGIESATAVALTLYAIHNLAATLVAIPAGRVADRRGFRIVLTGGFVFGLVAYLLFAITGAEVLILGVAFVAAGITIGTVETAEHGAVAEAAPEEVRGSAFGFLAAIQSFGNLAASGVAGLLWTLVSPFTAFMFAATLMAAAVLAGATITRHP
jgi:MFS family permease